LIVSLTPSKYYLYDSIPSRFWVESVYRVEQSSSGLILVEEPVEQPFTRDYRSVGHDTPSSWAKEFDLSRWGIFVAMDRDQPVGGAAVALDGPVFPVRHMQRKDLAVLWDIRIHPDHKGRGIGTALFRHAAAWAREMGYNQLGIETDSSNIPACKFYIKLGCELGGILKYGYSGVSEVAEYAMLLWYLDM
jgi:ribosomal protein S18 acetylase RimI-like enzyme